MQRRGGVQWEQCLMGAAMNMSSGMAAHVVCVGMFVPCGSVWCVCLALSTLPRPNPPFTLCVSLHRS